jgi:hypothetical protein
MGKTCSKFGRNLENGNVRKVTWLPVFGKKKSMFNPEENPVLYTIAESVESLLVKFSKKGRNFLSSFIFENQTFTLGLRSRETLNKESWGATFHNND